MKIHELTQGSPEWLAYRAQHFNASDAPAMMGCSPYKTRAKLLREMHTGVAADVDIATQKRFDNGHRAEALARPLAEQIVGEDLYPVTGSEGRLSASFDGLTLDESTVFEHKALNAEIRAAFDLIDGLVGGGDDAPGRLLPIHHRVQMEQQLHVSGAGRALFLATEWSADGELIEQRSVWYLPDDELRGQILAGWAQFERDLQAYVLPDTPAPAAAEPMESLPAVAVRMDGSLVVQSNLPAFGQALRAFVERVPKAPSTDNEFATTEAACKALKRAEEALDQAEANALASMADVEAMRRMVADFRKLARDTRLAAEKMVDRRKVEIKEQAVAKARAALDAHIASLNAEIAPMRLPAIAADFAGAIKGLKSVASMQDKLDQTLAVAKIAADADAKAIRANVATFKAAAEGFEFLFADLGQIVHKAADDFAAVLQARIAQHKAAEAEKARQRAEAEARAAEQRRQAEEAARLAAEAAAAKAKEYTEGQHPQQVLKAEPATADATDRGPAAIASPRGGAMGAGQAAAAAPAGDEPATLRLGTICERLGFTMTAAFVSDTLGIKPAKTDGRAMLYREGDFGRICAALQRHIERAYAAQREGVAA